MSRTILHSDMNCFYASVEMLHHPELAGKPMAVGGDPEARHGIVLTANYIAKEISSRIKYELGVTVSIGVSWNKIFAKLGSDYKKPDAITEFSKDNYKHRCTRGTNKIK